MNAAERLGDLRTLDWCESVEPAAFGEFGEPRPITQNSLDSCRITVTIGAENVTVNVGKLSKADELAIEDELVALSGDARVVETTPASGSGCGTAVVFADGIAAQSVAVPPSGDSRTAGQACDIARTGAEAIFDAVESGQIAHWEPPGPSLARLPACGILSDAKVSRLLNIEAGSMRLTPGEHHCEWGPARGTPPMAALDFEAAGESATGAGATGKTIGGRWSIVTPTTTGDVAICSVTTEHIPYANGTGGEHERAAIRVMLRIGEVTMDANRMQNSEEGKPDEGEGEQACGVARKLAAQAWPRLPKP
ncbi:MAG: hypothetical protein GEU86_18690 [Actinophytocola sp.]|nr:hypothetical protein [Actinophytocola sp.]